MKCSIADCNGERRGQGLCMKHYQRLRKYGSPHILKHSPAAGTTCSVNSCDRETKAKGLCQLHYNRLSRFGSFEPPMTRLRLHEEDVRFWAWVDITPTCWNWMLRPNRGGYGRFLLDDGRREYAHRYAYRNVYGAIPDDLTVDHICFNTKCVNPDHLQLLSRGDNARRKQTTETKI